MSEVITFLLAIASFAFIAYPLLSRKSRPAPSVTDDALSDLQSKRNTTYSMLKELEFDHSSGILTDEDYKDLESRYKKKAIDILKGIDEQAALATDTESEMEKEVQEFREGGTAATGIDADLEREVQRFRRGKAAPAGRQPEPGKDVSDVPSGRGPFCSQCGARSQSGDRFCTHCGTKLMREKR